MTLPLSKTLDPADFTELAEELAVVDQHFTKAAVQHPMRRWEYAMALRAATTYDATVSPPIHPLALPIQIYDVGGAGSPFQYMLANVWVIDSEAEGAASRCTLAEFITRAPRLAHAVFCLSVIEHVDELDRFLHHLGSLVVPGGLLFLTMDYCGHDEHELGLDQHHFHWMRKRIFSPLSLGAFVTAPLLHQGFQHLGPADWTYHGDHVYDYSFASLALVKRP